MAKVVDSELDADGNWILRVDNQGDAALGKATGLSIGGRVVSSATTAAHIVDRDGCRSGSGDPCLATNELAHELYRAFAWVDWVSVHRSNRVFVAKVKHSYPVDVRPELRVWLVQGSKLGKRGEAFELQVKATELEPVHPLVIVGQSRYTTGTTKAKHKSVTIDDPLDP